MPSCLIICAVISCCFGILFCLLKPRVARTNLNHLVIENKTELALMWLLQQFRLSRGLIPASWPLMTRFDIHEESHLHPPSELLA